MTDKEILTLLRKHFRTQDMFHTPQSRQEADDWVALQSKGAPQAGIFFMVGYNYAVHQMHQVISGIHPSMKEPVHSEDIPADAIEDHDPDEDGKDNAHDC